MIHCTDSGAGEDRCFPTILLIPTILLETHTVSLVLLHTVNKVKGLKLLSFKVEPEFKFRSSNSLSQTLLMIPL